jgi:hypothetical protein
MNYKLTTQAMTTHGDCQWEIGVKKTAAKGKMKLCKNTVLHYYDSPLLAVLLNPIHADIVNPRLFELETSKVFVTDQLKFGCKSQTLVKEIPLPEITTNQKIAVAIICALEVYQEKSFAEWANNWLSGKDRTARAAAYAADAAARAAAADAADAARAAAHAADAAAYAAARAAAKINFEELAEKAMGYE